MVDYSSLFMFSSFVAGFSLPGDPLDYVSGKWVGEWWCVMHTCLLCRFTQAVLELVRRNGVAFLSVAQPREVFHGLGFQDIA
jgi:hypothetical protein